MKHPSKVFYLAGGMTGLSTKERNEWRIDLEEKFSEFYHINLFNPNNHWDMESVHTDDREAMEYDLYRLRNADVLIVCFNSVGSLGTMAEIAIAHELRIPIIGINPSGDNFDLHPWQVFMCQKIVSNTEQAFEYLLSHYVFED